MEVNGEVTSLIFKGKLNDALIQRYNEMDKVFHEIAQKRGADFNKLAQECGKDKEAFLNGVLKILADELGMTGFEPKVEIADTGTADGLADWTSGTIKINKYTSNAEKLVEIISHEFTHMLQYRDILAQYGEQGLREIIMNDKSIPVDRKEAEIKAILESPYTKEFLDNYSELQNSEVGSLNEYITRIYKDEFANPVNPDTDMQGYVNQITEREAYHLGSEQLGNGNTGLGQVVLADDVVMVQGPIQEINGQRFRINEDGTIERLDYNLPKSIGGAVRGFFNNISSGIKAKGSNPLDIYTGSSRGIEMNKSHSDWMASRPDLFDENMRNYNCWRGYTPADQHHGAWKMHLYSVSEADWRMMCDVIIPYLKDRGV